MAIAIIGKVSRTRKHKTDENGRECSQCDEYKFWSEFYAGAGENGKDTRCKNCMRAKVRKHNQEPAVQDRERLRWIERWRAAHPGEEYERRQFCHMDDYGRECSYSGQGNCGHLFKPWSEFRTRRDTRCKPCQAQRSFYRSFLITEADRAVLAKAAVFGVGLCDLHGGPETMTYQRHGGTAVRGLSVDHAHDCTQGHAPEKGCRYCIRGLLCCDCNRNIVRRAEQFPALAARFQDYLDRRPLVQDKMAS